MREDRPFLVWSSGIEQEDFLKKKKTLRGSLENSPTAVSSPPATRHSHRGVGGIEPKSAAPGRVRTSGRPGPQAPGTKESAHHIRPQIPVTQKGVECLNLWVQDPLESWAGGCLSAGGKGEELG